MKRLALLFFTASMLLAASKIKDAPPVSHVADAPKTEAKMAVGGRLTVQLPNPDSSPYEWDLIGMNAKLLTVVAPPKPVPDANPPAWSVTFQSLRFGRTPVRFIWSPKGNNKIETPTAMREVYVTIE